MNPFTSYFIYIALTFSILIASCDEPTTPVDKPSYSFAFSTKKDQRVMFTVGSYSYPVAEKHKPEGDARTITYSSSSDAIATVNNAGKVTFNTQGTVTITAEKAAKGEYEKVKATYTLYITMKPTDKENLATEIKRAMTAHGNNVDLNYIDTSAITDMSSLFTTLAYSSHSGYDLEKFAGDISKWVVSSVTQMYDMFAGAEAFNSDISSWDISRVTNMRGMFHYATAFKQNLNAWESKLNNKIKESRWSGAGQMFRSSGLASDLPNWCKKNTECKNKQGE